jgi:hypothetical protein
MNEFMPFPKIARYSRLVWISEKIDGTNAQILNGEDGEFQVGSRNRWLSPDDDNYGFARWAYAHKAELQTLGPGRHFGEWWGNGINRGYGLPPGDKRLSLFNVQRFRPHGSPEAPQRELPPCVGLVPILWVGNFDALNVNNILHDLRTTGSYAVRGFLNPEGIVIYHEAAKICFKKTIEHDETPKSQAPGAICS